MKLTITGEGDLALAYHGFATTRICLTRQDMKSTKEERPKKRNCVIYSVGSVKIKILVWGTLEHMRAEIVNDNP